MDQTKRSDSPSTALAEAVRLARTAYLKLSELKYDEGTLDAVGQPGMALGFLYRPTIEGEQSEILLVYREKRKVQVIKIPGEPLEVKIPLPDEDRGDVGNANLPP